jgi:hypothetical protein
MRWISGLAALAALLVLAPEAQANASIFYDYNSTPGPCTNAAPCWQAGMFGLLVGLGSSVGQSGFLTESTGGPNDNIRGTGTSGDVGIGAGSFINTSNGNAAQTWAGPVDFADPCSGTCSTTHTFSVPKAADVLTNVTLLGGTTVGNANVTSGLTEILSISNYWSAQSGTSLGTLTGGIIGTTTGPINGTVRVFTVNSIDLTSVLTIDGNANDLIIINDPSNAIFTKNVTLNGVTPDQVLFNVYGTVGTVLSINGGGGAHSVIMGDIITRGQYYATNATVDGRILGGYGTILLGANFEMSVPADTPSFVPEPGEYAMLAGGFAALFYFGRKLRGKTGLPMSARIRAQIQAGAEGLAGEVATPGASAVTEHGECGPPIREPGIPPPRDGGGGGSGGVDRSLAT